MPNQLGLQPSYETSKYEIGSMQNTLHVIVTPDGRNNTAKIHQNLSIFLSRVEKGKHISFHSENIRTFLFIIEGQLLVNDKKLQSGDTARIESVNGLKLKAEEDTFLMLINLP